MYIPLIQRAKRGLGLDDVIAVFANGAYDDATIRNETRETLGYEPYVAIDPRGSKPLKAVRAHLEGLRALRGQD